MLRKATNKGKGMENGNKSICALSARDKQSCAPGGYNYIQNGHHFPVRGGLGIVSNVQCCKCVHAVHTLN